MDQRELTRDEITTELEKVLEPLPLVYAMWEAGAAAFDRVDDWSDIDLQIDVADEAVDDVAHTVEDTLKRMSPIDCRYEIPQPAWHGHYQVFYRLENASPFLLIDLCIMKHSNPNKFLQQEIHGKAHVFFDKASVVTAPPLDRDELETRLRERLAALRVNFDLFQILTLKELERHNNIEAIAFYQGYTLRPLLEMLRIRYVPARYNFSTRYVYYDLPKDVVSRLEPLYFCQDAQDLRLKREQAEQWFLELMQESNRFFPVC